MSAHWKSQGPRAGGWEKPGFGLHSSRVEVVFPTEYLG